MCVFCTSSRICKNLRWYDFQKSLRENISTSSCLLDFLQNIYILDLILENMLLYFVFFQLMSHVILKFLTLRVSPPAPRVQHVCGRIPERSASRGSKTEPTSHEKWSPKPRKSEENRVQTRPRHTKIRKKITTQQRTQEHFTRSPPFSQKWRQHGRNLAPQIEPKSLKIDLKIDQILGCFWDLVFFRF